MDKNKYVAEVERQLLDEKYYKKVENIHHESMLDDINKCIKDLEIHNKDITDQFDTFPTTIRKPQFYILPKTHKLYDDNLPLGYPGRPIVSASSSCTENISKYCDFILNPFMQMLPSYVKDTTDFINKIKDIKLKDNSYLVTLDVSSLYTNIPHEEGMEACCYFLD